MSVTIKSTAVASGGGSKPKVSDLKEFVNQVPDEARVTFEVSFDQRDGDSWTLTAEWEGPARDKPALSFPPGVRGGGSDGQYWGTGHP